MVRKTIQKAAKRSGVCKMLHAVLHITTYIPTGPTAPREYTSNQYHSGASGVEVE